MYDVMCCVHILCILLQAVVLAWLCTHLMKIPHLRIQYTVVVALEFLSGSCCTGMIMTFQRAEDAVLTEEDY
jgi:hypothetical protein